MKPAYDNIIQVGTQDLMPIGDSYRMVIKEIMPHKGTHGKFGIRDKILDTVLRKGKRLSVTFRERPGLEFTMNPIRWMSMGEEKQQVGLYKDTPMRFWWFYINYRDEIKKPEQERLFV